MWYNHSLSTIYTNVARVHEHNTIYFSPQIKPIYFKQTVYMIIQRGCFSKNRFNDMCTNKCIDPRLPSPI